ncbi:hypothetical protein [Aeromicrobium sp. P5_D10]
MASEIDPAQVILDRIAAREVERAQVEAATSTGWPQPVGSVAPCP